MFWSYIYYLININFLVISALKLIMTWKKMNYQVKIQLGFLLPVLLCTHTSIPGGLSSHF